jgi:precorrin-6A/cobalt-precorrin-6A reductase
MFLILGGTTEASDLASLLAARPDIASLVSLAGRTSRPVLPPIPCRIGGFGGAAGLARFIREAGIDAVVDATHPFAERISANARAACRDTATPLLVLRRPPWGPMEGDRWTSVASADEAAAALGTVPRRVFLTVGRLELAAFLAAPHSFVVRTIDAPDRLPARSRLILARGPFRTEDERRLIVEERIDVLVTKNSGGAATYAKLEAARMLGLPVILIAPPQAPDGEVVVNARAAMRWIEDRAHVSSSQPRGE